MTKADLIESVASKLDLPEGAGRARRQHDLRRHRRRAAQRRQGQHLGLRHVRGLGAQGAHGPQSEDRREHPDRGVEVGQVQGRQDPQGLAQLIRTPRARRRPRPRAVSSAGEHRPYKPRVTGSIPAPPISGSRFRGERGVGYESRQFLDPGGDRAGGVILPGEDADVRDPSPVLQRCSARPRVSARPAERQVVDAEVDRVSERARCRRGPPPG